ncbi:MAG: hypothetical protein KF712_07035 [Akkermansiaceae bacterium]|nr:hypothetical protein [Akkermansiaceae bacterium]
MVIVDESLTGDRLRTFTIESLDERMSVREIIRARIWQEVQDHNSAKRAEAFDGLVRSLPQETTLNGEKVFRPVDWEKQYETALRAFEGNGYFILIGNRQAESLDETFLVEAETEVSFVRFTPLVGG